MIARVAWRRSKCSSRFFIRSCLPEKNNQKSKTYFFNILTPHMKGTPASYISKCSSRLYGSNKNYSDASGWVFRRGFAASCGGGFAAAQRQTNVRSRCAAALNVLWTGQPVHRHPCLFKTAAKRRHTGQPGHLEGHRQLAKGRIPVTPIFCTYQSFAPTRPTYVTYCKEAARSAAVTVGAREMGCMHISLRVKATGEN